MSMKRRMNDSGVSEVVGSILTLAVTVIIFTGIFYGVQTIEPPQEQIFVKFSSNVNISNQTAYINITHNGGVVMSDYNTRIYITVDYDAPFNVEFTDDQGGDLADGRWRVSETMRLVYEPDHTIAQAFPDRNSTVELTIYDIDAEQRVHREMLKTKDELAPIVRDVGVDYPLDFGVYAIPGETVTLWADVIDKDTLVLDNMQVWINLSKLGGNLEQMERRGNRPLKVNRFTHTFELPELENGTYLIPVNTTDGFNHGDITYLALNMGQAPDIGIEAELQIQESRIFFLPENPANGDVFEVTAAIFNAGGTATVGDVTFRDIGPDGTELYNETVPDIGFPSGGGRDVSVNWRIQHSGLHNIFIEVEYNGEMINASRPVIVRPNILLVDDDQVGDGQPGDDASLMANALDSLGFRYDRTVVGGGSGPRYLGGHYPMVNYDIVIWMTGSQTTNTLTSQDRDELGTFIENGHRLWLIGEGICDDAYNNWGGWLEANLKSGIDTPDAGAPINDLSGTYDPVADMEFDIRSPRLGKSGSHISGRDGGNNALKDDGNTVGVAYNSTDPGGARTFFTSIRFAAIESRSALAYPVLLWLGNISEMGGNDLAISAQEFSTRTPDYMDTLTISAVIRNNGFFSQSPEVGLEVEGDIVERQTITISERGGHKEVEFEWVADAVGRHKIRVIVDPSGHIPETNIQNNYPDYLGIDLYVDVRFTTLIVDSTIGGDEIFDNVKLFYDTLNYSYEIFEVQPGGGGPLNTTMASYNSICWLTGSKSDDVLTENDIENITVLLQEYDDKKNFMLIGDGILEYLKNSPSDNAATFLTDILKINNVEGHAIPSPTYPRSLIGTTDDPIGHGIRYYMDGGWTTSPIPHYYETSPTGIPIMYYAYNGQNRTMAHRYEDDDYRLVFTGFDLENLRTPVPAGEEEFYEMYSFDTSPQAMRSEFLYLVNRWFGTLDERIELRISDVDITLSDHAPMLSRSYLLTARVQNIGGTGSNVLVRFRDGHSHIGSVSAYVPPDGFSDVEVKWKPINAAPSRPLRVILDPIDEVAEIPNEPGVRNQTDLMGFNNQAILHNPVYYFYDDMELDSRIADNWRHEAQIARISGENEAALDFMGDLYGDLETNVADDWDWSMTHEQVQNYSDDAYSQPDSYFMYEPQGRIGIKPDAIVSIVIDNSHHMTHGTHGMVYEGELWIRHATRAAKHLVNELSNESMVGVWAFTEETDDDPDGEAIRVREPLLLRDHREEILGVIDAIGGDDDAIVEYGLEEYGFEGGCSKTFMWDGTGGAYRDVMNKRLEDEHAATLTPAVVTLGAGADKSAALHAANPGQWETGSKAWAPWHAMEDEYGFPERDYGDGPDGSRFGKYRFSSDYVGPHEPGDWTEVGDHPGFDIGRRRGLLDAPIPIFTIGLGLEHNPSLDDEDVDEVDWNPAPNFDSAGDENYLIERIDDDKRTWEAGTVEYNLWRIANTSEAEYFYAPDPGDLEDIFDTIGFLLTGPQNLTSVPPSNTIMGTDDEQLTEEEEEEIPNVDKYAVTPALDLTNTSEAWLTFMHKYRLIQGVNGAYIEIGYHDPMNSTRADGMMWRYIKPTVGPYTGNLLLQVDLPEDSFGNEIKWCWNGKSAAGTMQWEFVRLNLLRDEYQIPDEKLDTVRVRFYYKQYGGGLRPGGWLIDDVSVVVTREGNLPGNIHEGTHDVWHLEDGVVGSDGVSTSRAWRNADPNDGWFQKGIDNRLVTSSIDLTNARTANFTADFKFNINSDSGSPPDGFRVEITTDGGRNWEAINVGLRTASGISGSPATNNWTTAGELSKLNIDLSDYSGNIVRMRFRVFTNANEAYAPYEDDNTDGGLYIDNVIVHGETN